MRLVQGRESFRPARGQCCQKPLEHLRLGALAVHVDDRPALRMIDLPVWRKEHRERTLHSLVERLARLLDPVWGAAPSGAGRPVCRRDAEQQRELRN